MAISKKQEERYSRHIMLNEVGRSGQEKLLESRVLVIGAGGLGSSVLMYLAAAGIGTIGIADADKVDSSNLQRQIIHSERDINKAKVVSAKETINAMNHDVKVNIYEEFIHSGNIIDLVKEYDFIVDATDNFSSKFLINDACVISKKPFSHAGIMSFQGQLMTYVPGHGPCYRCIFKNPPPKEETLHLSRVGIIGAMCGVIGSMQAMEAVKYLVDAGNLLTGSLLTYDALKMEFRKIKLPEKVTECPVCGENPTIKNCSTTTSK
ncbi:MAG: HesA/MoeB/ThiF family protein [Clostridia bacterium]